MKINVPMILGAVLILFGSAHAQLTVEKIMQDPKTWVGTSPSGIFWDEDSKIIYFDWNPDANESDSLYQYQLSDKKIVKVPPAVRRKLPGARGSYNRLHTLKIYTKSGDLYLLDCQTFKTRQLTNTVEIEGSPAFSGDEQSVIFEKDDNLYSIALASGLLTQHTNFKSGTKKAEAKKSDEEKWLESDQLALFDILRERKARKDSAKKITEAEKALRPKDIYLGDKKVSAQQLSPDGRFVTYRLSKSDKNSKRTIVPNYVTQSGFTEDLPARTKVGDPATEFEFWVYDIAKDTMRQVSTKKLPGIGDKPDYLKDYPKLDTAWKKEKVRPVIVHGPSWSEDGRNAVVVVRSLDNKDRWIMAFDPDSLSLKPLDRQRDEAWIGGPGVGGYAQSAGELGWLDDHTIYFQSEADGYSHLYSLDVKTGKKTQLTEGKFEVQNVQLSRDKQHFYLTTNEVHPGEQHFYKMAVTGGPRTQLTKGRGAHEVALSPDETKLAVRYSNSNTPWELFLLDNAPDATAEQVTQSTTEAV